MDRIIQKFKSLINPSLGSYEPRLAFQVGKSYTTFGIAYTFFSLNISQGLYLIQNISSNSSVNNFYNRYYQQGFYLTFDFIGNVIQIIFYNPSNNIARQIQWNINTPNNTIITRYVKLSGAKIQLVAPPLLYPYLNPLEALKSSSTTFLFFNRQTIPKLTFNGNLYKILNNTIIKKYGINSPEITNNFKNWCKLNNRLHKGPLMIRYDFFTITIYSYSKKIN